MYKDRNSTLKIGPVWDFNGAMGNTDWRVPDWVIRYRECWYDRLLMDEIFLNKIISRWNALKVTNFSTQNIFSMIDNISSLLNESQKRNFLKWAVLGRYVYPSKPPYPSTYALEIKKLPFILCAKIAFGLPTRNAPYLANLIYENKPPKKTQQVQEGIILWQL